MILRQKYLRDEYTSLSCPADVAHRVWGNPHVKTGRQLEHYRLVMSKEALIKRFEHQEREWLKTVQQHEDFMAAQRKRIEETPTAQEMLAAGLTAHTEDADREWFY